MAPAITDVDSQNIISKMCKATRANAIHFLPPAGGGREGTPVFLLAIDNRLGTGHALVPLLFLGIIVFPIRRENFHPSLDPRIIRARLCPSSVTPDDPY